MVNSFPIEIVDGKLKQNQKNKFLNCVADALSLGKHISLLIPQDYFDDVLLINLAVKIKIPAKTLFIVDNNSIKKQLTNLTFKRKITGDISIVDELSEKNLSLYDFLFFYYVSDNRKITNKCIRNFSGKSVSIFDHTKYCRNYDFDIESRFNKNIVEENPKCVTFSFCDTSDVFDLRNILVDGDEDLRYKCFSDNKKVLDDLLNNELKIKLLTEKIKILEQENNDCKTIIKTYDQILSVCNIPLNLIEDVIDKILAFKRNISEDLKSPNETIRENAYSSLQNEIVNLVSQTFSKYRNEESYEFFLKELKENFGDSFTKLSENSVSFIVTAKYLFNNLSKQPNNESFDYSAVCLLVSKAVEIETGTRYFEKYEIYLNDNQKELPDSFYTYTDSGAKVKINHYTLGRFNYLVGHYKVAGEDGANKEKRERNKKTFLDYASKKLYNESDPSSLDKIIVDDCKFVFKTNEDYRKKSAHVELFEFVSAKECLKYIVEVEKKLKVMLDRLRY